MYESARTFFPAPLRTIQPQKKDVLLFSMMLESLTNDMHRLIVWRKKIVHFFCRLPQLSKELAYEAIYNPLIIALALFNYYKKKL